MFRMLVRTVRHLLRPISRPAALFLAWTHRYTVALWWRSIRDEFVAQYRSGTFDPARWKQLVSSLWRVSSDARLANSPELRRIAIEGSNVTVDAAETWQGRFLLDTRLGLSPLTSTITTDGVDGGVAPTPSAAFSGRV